MDAIDLLLLASTKFEARDSYGSNEVKEMENDDTKMTESDNEAVDAILSLSRYKPDKEIPPFNRQKLSFEEPSSENKQNQEELFPPSFRRQRSYSEPWGSNESYNVISKSVLPATVTVDDASPSFLIAKFFEKYASIYNKNGRIGIYTKQERSAIIQKYQEKRKKRNWKKQIRYSCRKNLADRRIRVRGRFVKLEDLPKEMLESYANGGLAPVEEDDYEDADEMEEDTTMTASNTTSNRMGKNSHNTGNNEFVERRKRSNSLTNSANSTLSSSFTLGNGSANSSSNGQQQQQQNANGITAAGNNSNSPSPLNLYLKPSQSPSSTQSESGLTINLTEIRNKRDRYQESLKNHHHAPPLNKIGEVEGGAKVGLDFLVDALNGSIKQEPELPPGKRLRGHSIAY